MDTGLDPLPRHDLVIAQIPLQHAHEARGSAPEDHRRWGGARDDGLDPRGGPGGLAMSESRQMVIRLLVAAGIIIGGGVGFYAGLSGWGILAGIVLAIVFAAMAGSEAVAWAAPIAGETDRPKT
jgi:hypothetical protein